MRHGWTREAKGLPSLDEQRAILVAHGTDPERIHQENTNRHRKPRPGEPTPFDYTLRVLREGDDLAVPLAACLGATNAEVQARLLGVCTRHRDLYDCQVGAVVAGEAGVAQFLGRADRGLAVARIATARRILAGSIHAPKMTDAKKRAVLPDWRNPEMTAAQVAAKHKVSRRQLFNAMGKRFPKGVQE